jgi:parallel beta-helix repeat protein
VTNEQEVLCIKEKATAIFLAVLLIGASAVLLSTEKVRATGTIYIRPDGTVDPQTAPLQRAGDVYTFTANIYESIVVQKDNLVIDGNNYLLNGSGSGFGFYLTNRINVTIRNSHVAYFEYGIGLNKSDGNVLTRNTLTHNLEAGILVSNSSSNLLSRNTVFNNTHDGITLWGQHTQENIITGNNVSNNGGISGRDGIVIGLRSSYNTIINNTVSSNSGAGIALGYEWSTGNIIAGNNITFNDWAGIYMAWETESGNQFYHNNMNNTVQVYTVQAANTWDNGYLSGGNYWSDYAGVDLYWGPYQNKTGSDGIGDTPYAIDVNNKDNYPLMSPYEYWINPLPGDINKDGKVDNNDLSQLTIAYGSTPEKPNWNPNSDLNTDNIVNASDLLRLGKNFGKTG